jgi:hypothetical protein
LKPLALVSAEPVQPLDDRAVAEMEMRDAIERASLLVGAMRKRAAMRVRIGRSALSIAGTSHQPAGRAAGARAPRRAPRR